MRKKWPLPPKTLPSQGCSVLFHPVSVESLSFAMDGNNFISSRDEDIDRSNIPQLSPVYSWFQCIFPRNIWFHRNAINERDNFVFLITRTRMMDFFIVILKFVRWDFPSWSVCIFSSTWSNSRWITTIFITFNDFKKWTTNLFNWSYNQNNYCWI